jgi:glycerophosphoryl diester phosphodiesterase
MTVETLVSLSRRPVIGHRGAAGCAPENTVVSLQRGLELGVEALEFDVRRAKGGEPVVIHDPTLDRTTDRSGAVRDFTVEELRTADAGFRLTLDSGATYPWRGQGIGVPTLREALAATGAAPLLIEVKEWEVAEATARVLLETGAAPRAVLAAVDWRALRPFRAAPFTLGASRRDIARLYFGMGRPDPECRSFAVPDRFKFLTVPTRRFVRAAHARKASVHVWTVDDPAAALRFWQLGVNGIVTNRPDLIIPVRNQAGLA